MTRLGPQSVDHLFEFAFVTVVFVIELVVVVVIELVVVVAVIELVVVAVIELVSSPSTNDVKGAHSSFGIDGPEPSRSCTASKGRAKPRVRNALRKRMAIASRYSRSDLTRAMLADMGEWTAETAEWYADKYGEYATNRLGVDELQLPSSAVVVDIGCGTGAALRHALQTVSEGRLVGVDPVPRMVEIAREKCDGLPIEILQGGASSVPLEADVADYVLAFDSYDHWQDKSAGLAEVRRILKPDGVFAVVKDSGVPGDRDAFLAEAHQAGFELVAESSYQKTKAHPVAYRLWTLRVAIADQRVDDAAR